ncbi:unnamed protein product [Heligmosomoides polygyrus]|uniref:tRNA:m(4)X modification enzyme TRM13 n=1 Tax=Heligmosomoides polygyrus TaxID=6339 RepID=A0A183G686_HELPZ|nr:unnamed protein product [Heligmosomoides polygyrus]
MSGSPRCSFVLPKKGRNCRMLVRLGEKYCGEHALYKEGNEKRIPCPNDPKHTVDRRALEQHLQRLRCNSRIVEEQWIVKDLNAIVGETKFTAKIDRRPSEEEISNVIAKLQSCYTSIKDQISAKLAYTTEIDQHIEQSVDISESRRKHLVQQSSIIGCWVPAKWVYLEGFASFVMPLRAPLSKFLLIDRSGARNKYDNKALQENPMLNIKRLRCSIEHLNLAEVKMLKEVSSICAVCKHFCGSATDAGIRCLLNAMNSGLRLDGFVLVPCCHHKSRYDEYTGKEFLAYWNMDSETDFAALRHVATWAVCGFANVSPTWKEEMGRRAKKVLEFGRSRHLAGLGFSTQVVEYVPASISPENLLIIGVRNK